MLDTNRSVVLSLALLLVACVPTASFAAGSARVIGMDDKEGEPYKESARVLLRAMAKGDVEACRAAFAGEGDDLKLMELTLETNNAFRGLIAAIGAKFGDAGRIGEDFVTPELRTINVQTIIVDAARPDEASISPGTFPFRGYELKKKGGKWCVRSITVFAEEVPPMIAAHQKLAPAARELTKRINDGEFRDAETMKQAVGRKLGPIMAEYSEKTERGDSSARPAAK